MVLHKALFVSYFLCITKKDKKMFKIRKRSIKWDMDLELGV